MKDVIKYKFNFGNDGQVSSIETAIRGDNEGQRRDWTSKHVNVDTMELNEAGLKLARSHLYPNLPEAVYVKV